MKLVAVHWKGTVALGAAAAFHVAIFLVWPRQDRLWMSPPANAEWGPKGETIELAPVHLIQLASVETEMYQRVPESLLGAAAEDGATPDDAFRDLKFAPGRVLGRKARGQLGQSSFVPRQDREYRSRSVWNVHSEPQMQRSGSQKPGQRTPEAIERQKKAGFSDRRIRTSRLARGSDRPRSGREDGVPMTLSQKRRGSIAIHKEKPRVERGLAATENVRRGPAEASLNMPARSSQRSPSIFELGAPSLGKQSGVGAGGSEGASVASHSGNGTAAQRGSGTFRQLAATRASRSDPYFWEMYRKIDTELRFPKELALALEQGDLVLRFRLDSKGEISEIKLSKPSGFSQFDNEALRAFRVAAPFGSPPAELLAGQSHIFVVAPYYFSNRLIR